MLICVDIGNTNITIGLYKNKDLNAKWRLATVHARMPDEYGIQMMNLIEYSNLHPKNIHGAIIASVVPPLTAKWVDVLEKYLYVTPLVVGTGIRTGVNNLYHQPSAVGADRIVNAAAAYRLHGGPACIVDFGTATTFDAISEKGDYLGGAISPGIGIAAEALFSRTAKLPRVDLTRPPAAIGRTTAHSMQSGILFGYVGLVEGMVSRFKQELGEQTIVIATGGLSEIIANETTTIDIIAPWLTLDGLRMIYELNTKG